MRSHENEPFVVNREVKAVMVPAGVEVSLKPGQSGDAHVDHGHVGLQLLKVGQRLASIGALAHQLQLRSQLDLLDDPAQEHRMVVR